MTIHLTRASVCMGDDADAPHAGAVELPPETELRELLKSISAGTYLASVAGGATWSVWHGSTLLATLHISNAARQMQPATLIAPNVERLQARDLDRLFFDYHCAADPAAVLCDPKSDASKLG